MRISYPFTPLPQGWCRRAVQAKLSPAAKNLALIVAEETLRHPPDRKRVLPTARLATLLGISKRSVQRARVEAEKAGLICCHLPRHSDCATYWIPNPAYIAMAEQRLQTARRVLAFAAEGER